MHQFRGYPDLRLNRSNTGSDISLWPSFTDIMTVILMVFMLTMVVVIIQNADLIEQIRLAQRLQDEALDKVAAGEQELADLRARATDLEEAIRSSRMEILLLTEEAERLDDQLEIKTAVIADLKGDKEDIEENLRLIRLRLQEREQELTEAQALIGGIREDAERTNRDLSRQIAELLRQLEEKDTVMLTLTDEKTDLERALARQRQDFSTLEDKYLALVRPARSALGKQVASVQYRRDNGGYRYLLKDIGGVEWEEMSREALFTRLGELKSRWGDELYIKIVIPDDSGLSYNQAWRFTKTVLSEFDYYYQDGW
ncbi:hypothetical protein KJ682_03355 [bacterium]|nr:hypothetical protein [bacterium]